MLVELTRPFALLLSIFSLYGVFYTAFLMPAVGMEDRIWLSLELMSLSAGICVVSGFLFREPQPLSQEKAEVEWRAWRARWSRLEHWDDQEHWDNQEKGPEPLISTLPVRLFCWACCLMVGLFILSWYLETYCILYRDVRRI